MAKISAKKVLKIFAITACTALMFGCVGVLFCLSYIQNSDDYVKFDDSRLTEICTGLKITDRYGNEIKEAFGTVNDRQIPLEALHDYTYGAFVAVEDKRFFSHSGLDEKRILGALLHNVRSGSYKEGASTISQQLIKNTHLDNTKSIKRKVNEMLLAKELEKKYTKNEILEMYLNTIYFGRNAYGIENAANVYFDKSARDLTVFESAMLAGMIKAPNNYAPDKNAEKCKRRRDLVLNLMKEQNIITEEQCVDAAASDICCVPYKAVEVTDFADMVIDEACRILNMTNAQLYHCDITIKTYYDDNVQQALNEFSAADETKNKDGSLANLSCVICGLDGGIEACYFRGNGVFAKKQIGSTAKPFAVYAPALNEKLITEASPVLDEPTDFSGYKPTNAGGYNGWTTVKNAVTKSLNVPAVKTLNTLGLNKAREYLKKLGFEGDQNLSLALGNICGGMTATELLNCYATLQNGGTNNGVGYIQSISDENGNLLYLREKKNIKVFDEEATYLMTDMLKSVVYDGTAKRLGVVKAEVAAKTGTVGTASGNSDAIVAGYTTAHTFVFWFGGEFGNDVSGSSAPCKLAASVLSKIYSSKTPSKFAVPKGIVALNIDKIALYNQQQVKLAADGSNGETFLFANNNKPKGTTETDKYASDGEIGEQTDGEQTNEDDDAEENFPWNFWVLPFLKG